MGRILAILMAVVMMLSLTACIDSAPTKELIEATSSKTAKEETFALNESAVFSNLKFTATEIKESQGDGFFVPENGNVFVGVKFTIENISNEEQTVSSLLLFEGYVDDIKCDFSLNASCAFDEGELDGSIAAGKKLVGWYALEVPKDWKEIELDVQSSWISNSAAKFVFTK